MQYGFRRFMRKKTKLFPFYILHSTFYSTVAQCFENKRGKFFRPAHGLSIKVGRSEIQPVPSAGHPHIKKPPLFLLVHVPRRQNFFKNAIRQRNLVASSHTGKAEVNQVY